MATEIKLPELGENIEGGDVVDVKVKEGAQVQEGQALLEVEAEKSTVEVPSPGAGRISKVLVKKGDNVKPGQTLFHMETADGKASEKPDAASEDTADKKEKPAPANSSSSERKEPAEPSANDDTATEEPAKPVSDGTPAQGDDKQVTREAEKTVIPAGPATRRLARELGVDLAAVAGSGPGRRVTQEDVKAFVKDRIAQPGAAPAPTPALPDFSKWGSIERQPLDAVRRKTAEQMALAWTLIPHVTHNDLADITELEAFRKQQDAKGPKVTVTAFALKAVAIALKQFPRFNSSLDLAKQQLIVKQYCHIGVAVDTERGLLVPVLRDVDKKSVQELATELAQVAERAREKKLGADEMRGGSFTITNLGGIGGTSFTPIVNYPEVAILGISRGRMTPVFDDKGQVKPRLLLPLSLSYDHRVIDGANAARFARYLVEMLENPLVMLLHA